MAVGAIHSGLLFSRTPLDAVCARVEIQAHKRNRQINETNAYFIRGGIIHYGYRAAASNCG